ncbi:MAG TPA: hypothetical protein VFW29_06120 [Solirubrobacteraceae bacterium]|nr:hypothetical protein [Solirubrobacteraceae bacterium]
MTLLVTRRLGALSLLAVGAVHLQQYLGAGYSSIPTIGWLFLLNAIGSALVAAALLAPLERAGRRGELAASLTSAIGVTIAVGSLIALFVSESGPLFGFQETGYRAAIVVAIAAEAVTAILLTAAALGHLSRSRGGERDWRARSRWHPGPGRPHGA